MITALWFVGSSWAQDVPVSDPPVADPAPAEASPALPEAPKAAPLEVAASDPPPSHPVLEGPTPQAFDQKIEASIELGAINNSDPAYQVFSGGDLMGDWGFRVGYRLAPRMEVRGGWHLARHGSDVSVPVPDTSADFQSSDQSFRAAFVAHEATMGLRLDASIQNLLLPYVAADAMLVTGRIRLDDAPDDPHHGGQVDRVAVSGGGIAVAGFELRAPPDEALAFAWDLEMGYAWVDSLKFADLGAMKPGGFVIRSGVGVRF